MKGSFGYTEAFDRIRDGERVGFVEFDQLSGFGCSQLGFTASGAGGF